MAQQDEDPDTELIIERLEERFPASDADHVKEIVDQEEERFAGAPVRDFVPVLVEREAREQLRAEGYEDTGRGPVVISDDAGENAGRHTMERIEGTHGNDFELDEGRGIPEDATVGSAEDIEDARFGALEAGSFDGDDDPTPLWRGR